MSKPSITNCPNTFFRKFIVSAVDSRLNREERWFFTNQYSLLVCKYVINPLSGGYCGEVPPLPIPNREVKLTCADGTAMQCGRVGSRLLSISEASDFERFLRLFCFHAVLLSYRQLFPTALFTFLPFYSFTFILIYIKSKCY